MSKPKKHAPLLILALLLGSTVSSAILVDDDCNQGCLVTFNVSVFVDSECTQELATIQWGDLSVGQSADYEIFVKYNGTIVNMTLSMMVENFNPALAASYLNLTWDQEGTVLAPKESVAALIVLSASPDTEGFTDFSFDIIISGTG